MLNPNHMGLVFGTWKFKKGKHRHLGLRLELANQTRTQEPVLADKDWIS